MAAPAGHALVSYSSSSEDETSQSGPESPEDRPIALKRHCDIDHPAILDQKSRRTEPAAGRLPLPSSLVAMFEQEAVDDKVIDDPRKHGGRVRAFQHEKGNWASYVYAPVKADERLLELVESLIKCLRPHGSFNPSEDVHLSLSRTFVIRHHWIQPLVQSLTSNLKHCPRCDCVISSVSVYTNDEKTRTFIGLKIDTSTDRLRSYVSEVDSSLEEFKLPVYYKDPSFHISVVWAVGDLQDVISEKTRSRLQEILDEFLEENPRLGVLSIKTLEFKTGNKVYSIDLDTSR